MTRQLTRLTRPGSRNPAIVALGLALCLAGVSIAGPAAAAHHEKVLQVVAVSVESGKLPAYQKEVKKLAGVLTRVDSKATMRMWQATQGGPNTGTVLVALEFANAATWAADAPRVQGDTEWQDIVEDLDEIRTLEGSAIWKEITPRPSESPKPKPGTILVVTGVDVKPGMLGEYRKRLEAGQAIVDRLKISGNLRMWQATLAGPNTGAVAVGVEYPSLEAYVADEAKLSGDAEWQKLIAGLDGIRTLRGRTMYREITP